MTTAVHSKASITEAKPDALAQQEKNEKVNQLDTAKHPTAAMPDSKGLDSKKTPTVVAKPTDDSKKAADTTKPTNAVQSSSSLAKESGASIVYTALNAEASKHLSTSSPSPIKPNAEQVKTSISMPSTTGTQVVDLPKPPISASSVQQVTTPLSAPVAAITDKKSVTGGATASNIQNISTAASSNNFAVTATQLPATISLESKAATASSPPLPPQDLDPATKPADKATSNSSTIKKESTEVTKPVTKDCVPNDAPQQKQSAMLSWVNQAAVPIPLPSNVSSESKPSLTPVTQSSIPAVPKKAMNSISVASESVELPPVSAASEMKHEAEVPPGKSITNSMEMDTIFGFGAKPPVTSLGAFLLNPQRLLSDFSHNTTDSKATPSPHENLPTAPSHTNVSSVGGAASEKIDCQKEEKLPPSESNSDKVDDSQSKSYPATNQEVSNGSDSLGKSLPEKKGNERPTFFSSLGSLMRELQSIPHTAVSEFNSLHSELSRSRHAYSVNLLPNWMSLNGVPHFGEADAGVEKRRGDEKYSSEISNTSEMQEKDLPSMEIETDFVQTSSAGSVPLDLSDDAKPRKFTSPLDSSPDDKSAKSSSKSVDSRESYSLRSGHDSSAKISSPSEGKQFGGFDDQRKQTSKGIADEETESLPSSSSSSEDEESDVDDTKEMDFIRHQDSKELASSKLEDLQDEKSQKNDGVSPDSHSTLKSKAAVAGPLGFAGFDEAEEFSSSDSEMDDAEKQEVDGQDEEEGEEEEEEDEEEGEEGSRHDSQDDDDASGPETATDYFDNFRNFNDNSRHSEEEDGDDEEDGNEEDASSEILRLQLRLRDRLVQTETAEEDDFFGSVEMAAGSNPMRSATSNRPNLPQQHQQAAIPRTSTLTSAPPKLSGSLLSNRRPTSSMALNSSSTTRATSSAFMNNNNDSDNESESQDTGSPHRAGPGQLSETSTSQCPYCLRRVPTAEFFMHKRSCDLRSEPCIYGCGMEIRASKMREHIEVCESRQRGADSDTDSFDEDEEDDDEEEDAEEEEEESDN
mmetsp:Transcript_22792/g.31275  ORF Transcript_22792/g.31275 Transcript_22792/m.31275 type:complete len:1030 (-) Transcript_22792:237-3326(-)